MFNYLARGSRIQRDDINFNYQLFKTYPVSRCRDLRKLLTNYVFDAV